MLNKTKKWYGLSLLVCSLLFMISAMPAQAEIPPYYRGHYTHAKQILEQHDPDFLIAFDTLSQEIKGIESYDQRAQYEALMRFFPHIEHMLQVSDNTASYEEQGITWDLKLEVVVSFFLLDMPTADNKTTHIEDLLFDAFQVYLAGGDAIGILSEKTLMNKYQISQEKAQHIRKTLRRLYSTRALL